MSAESRVLTDSRGSRGSIESDGLCFFVFDGSLEEKRMDTDCWGKVEFLDFWEEFPFILREEKRNFEEEDAAAGVDEGADMERE